MKLKLATRVALVATATTLCLGQAGQALAADGTNSAALDHAADRAASQVQQVSPVVDGDGARLSSVRGNVAVSLPSSGDGVLRLGSGDTTIGLGLPEMASGRQARVVADGKVAFADPKSSVQVVTERVDALSARTLVVLNDSSAPTDYRFDVQAPAGSVLSPQADGGVNIVDAQGTVLGQVAAPWAKDAAGTDVKTSYRIDGDTLVQTVELTKETQFPVVADPKLTYGFGVYLNLWGWEANSYGAGLGILLAGGAIAVCTAGNIPAAITQLVKIICSAGVGAAAYELLKNLHDYIRSGHFRSGTCYQKKIIPSFGAGWVGVDGSNCQ